MPAAEYDVAMPYKAVTVAIAIPCAKCHASLLVGTLAEAAHCTPCDAATTIPYRGLLDVDVRGSALSLADILPGLGPTTSYRGRLASVSGAPPACACGVAFPEAELAKVGRHRPYVACACGVRTPARKAPDALVKAYESAIVVVGEVANTAAHPQVGIVIRCGSCNANLPLASEATTCAHCGATNARPLRAGAPASAGPPIGIVFRL